MIPVRYHPAAREELRAAIRHDEDDRPGSGALLEAAVHHVLRRLRRLPRSAPRWPGWKQPIELRRAVVKRHPYIVVYVVVPEQLVIVAVAHTRRMPGYWRDRLIAISDRDP